MTDTAPASTSAVGRTLASFGPNWFASVMGTGIVATGAATLPISHPLLTDAATVVWGVALALLVVVVAATVQHHRHHRGAARAWVDHPVLSHFHGATAMAPIAVGAATLTAGIALLGERPAVLLAAALWTVGTALGVWTALSPRIRSARAAGPAEAYWLMPVVAPMVSAALGALLASHLPAGGARVTAEVVSWVCFALALALSARLMAGVVRRIAGGDVPSAAPTLFIVLGPLGQSATAALLLGALGPTGLRPVTLGYAVLALLAALVWLVVAAVCVVRTRPAFTMTWWSFTFPIGTVVTGLSGLAVTTGLTAAAAAATTLYAGLVTVWAIVAARTLLGVRDGSLLR